MATGTASEQDAAPTAPATPVRCSTAEREATCARLHTAAGEGRLTMDEVDERLTAVYAARYRHELAAATADLPPARPSAAGWRAVLTLLWAQLLAELSILLGKTPGQTTRRRLVIAATVAALVLLAGGFLAFGFVIGGEHHGFGFPGRGAGAEH